MRSVPAWRSSHADRFPWIWIGVRAVEEDDLSGELGLLENPVQIFLGPPRLGEDEGLLLERRSALFFCAFSAAANPRRRAVRRTSPFEFLMIDFASAWNSRDMAISCLQFVQLAGESCRRGASATRSSLLHPRAIRPRSQAVLRGCRPGLPVAPGTVGGVGYELKPVGQPRACLRSHRWRTGQQLAQDQRHQLTLAGRKGVKRVLLEVFGDEIVEALFVRARHELLHERMAVRVLDVFENLPAKRALTYGREPLLQFCEVFVAGQARVLGAETLDVAECEFVDDADEAVELQQGVL